jgi:uncharacterized protein DUF6907
MAAPTGHDPDSPDPCPSWCRRAHAAGDHPDDRHHHSRVLLVAVVTGHPTLEPDDRAHPASVAVRLVRRAGSTLTWLEVLSEEGQQVRLVLTAESARHLLTTAGGLLSQV